MAQFSELESLLSLASSVDTSKFEEIYGAVATHIGAQGASKLAEAVIELKSIGVDPDMYISPSKAYVRRQRELDRMAPEKAEQSLRLELMRNEAAAEAKHKAELRAIEIASAKAAAAQSMVASAQAATAPAFVVPTLED